MRDEATQLLRGSLYLARLRLRRLEHEYALKPNEVQLRAIRDARRALEQVEERAKEEGIAPFATTPEDTEGRSDTGAETRHG